MYVTDQKLCYISKQFRHKTSTLKEMLAGKRGYKKQIYAVVICSFDKSFINAIKDKEPMEFIEGIEYLNDKNINEFFGIASYQTKRWDSEEKALLLQCMYHTPVCYIKNRIDVFNLWCDSSKDYKKFFPKSKPKEEDCKKCDFMEDCKVVY